MSFGIASLNSFRNVDLGGNNAIVNLGCNTFAPGCIIAMVREASAAKIGDIRSLSGMAEQDGKTSKLYNLIIEGKFEGDDYNNRKIVAIKDAANRVAMTLLDIAANVSEALGDEPFAIDDCEGEPDQEMADARVFADIEEFADRAIAEENALHGEE